ncbi:3'-5' exonuclease family protein [Isoptericola rhizosphaerae]|uniref:hypothetical protein n=1 Tax=Isoptericola rhizosphaerae TaxID=3377837 RepID=UPI00383BD354
MGLPKEAVRTSDWASTVLSSEQIEDAANDVVHLLDLYDRLEEDLASARLIDIYDACCGFLPAKTEVAALGIEDIFAY